MNRMKIALCDGPLDPSAQSNSVPEVILCQDCTGCAKPRAFLVPGAESLHTMLAANSREFTW